MKPASDSFRELLAKGKRLARIEKLWLMKHDAHFERFARQIGAQIDRERSDRPSRHFVTRGPSGLKKEIVVRPQGEDENSRNVRGIWVAVSVSTGLGDSHRWCTREIHHCAPNRWDVLGRVLERAWQELDGLGPDDLEFEVVPTPDGMKVQRISRSD